MYLRKIDVMKNDGRTRGEIWEGCQQIECGPRMSMVPVYEQKPDLIGRMPTPQIGGSCRVAKNNVIQ
jgi:hypothetical protein